MKAQAAGDKHPSLILRRALAGLQPHLHRIKGTCRLPGRHAPAFGLNFNSTAKLHPALLTSPFNYKIKMALIEFLTVTLGSH